MNWWSIALIVVAAVMAFAVPFVYLSNKWLKVTHYEIKSEKVPEGGVKIVHLSDLHAAKFGRKNRRLIKAVRTQSPDFIALTGDMIHKYRDRDIAAAKRTVRDLCGVAPVYIVSGNHEMRNKRWRAFREELKECGARVLEDEAESAYGINIVGVNCAMLKSAALFNAAEGCDGFKLLLAHKPEFIDRYALAGYDLALCGHAHGGQWRIPVTSVGIYSPGQGMFPKYTSGVHSCGNMREVISRGLGNSECPLRLFNRPEIVVVDLKKSE